MCLADEGREVLRTVRHYLAGTAICRTNSYRSKKNNPNLNITNIMNKTIIININGMVFHIEEDAYEVLKNYMTDVTRHFLELGR
jgi:hypothetical protein